MAVGQLVLAGSEMIKQIIAISTGAMEQLKLRGEGLGPISDLKWKGGGVCVWRHVYEPFKTLKIS